MERVRRAPEPARPIPLLGAKMPDSEPVMPDLEPQARRAAMRVGLYATKPRRRRGTLDNLGGFSLLDPVGNTVVGGEASERCGLSAEDVLEYCEALMR
jgi:hypothetical protein